MLIADGGDNVCLQKGARTLRSCLTGEGVLCNTKMVCARFWHTLFRHPGRSREAA
jgi:hypothetical protein